MGLALSISLQMWPETVPPPRLLLSQAQRHVYAQVARYCNRSADLIPLSFVLGEAPASSPWHLP